MKTLYQIRVKNAVGEEVDLSCYRGKVLLIVNVASRCGFTPQYRGLQALFSRFRDRGFRVLAFPCNDFLNQEPGTEAEILQFCEQRYQVDFDLFGKIKILGPNPHPLFQVLQGAGLRAAGPAGLKSILFGWFKRVVHFLKGAGRSPSEVQWNFHKFLVDREGRVAAHFSSDTDPNAPILIARIEEELARG